MMDIPSQLSQDLKTAGEKLRQLGLESEARDMETLAAQVFQPCVVAVVGRVKAGKSTFINALLGDDLAKVGTTETTATINYFRAGTPLDPANPVRCVWRSGQVSNVNQAFLNGLQGSSEDILRRAEGIARLEYYLPNPFLEQVTLVDTPGTGAVVDEHQDRTAAYLRLSQQLRQRHDEETQQLGSTADAVIYLIGQVARSGDKALLDEFRQVTQGRSRAMNAIGVMAKIDLQPEVLARRNELAEKIASQLRDSLNTVIPASAGIRRAVDCLLENDRSGLLRLMTALRQISPEKLDKLLSSEELFLETENCPVSCAERQALLGDLPWSVFVAISRAAADPALDAEQVLDQLDQTAGFGPLKTVLERHFFRRGQFLRCFRIVGDARQVLAEIQYFRLPERRDQYRADQARKERFLAFIRSAGGSSDVQAELARYVQEQFSENSTAALEEVLSELERTFSRIFHELENYNADFEALQDMEDHVGLFHAEELDELRAVFGLYGLETGQRLPARTDPLFYVEDRQQAWRLVNLRDRSPIRASVAERAVFRYGLILEELTGYP